MEAIVNNVLRFLRGSTRPGMTALFSLALVWGFWDGRVTPEAFIGLVGPVIGFWVRDRVGKKDNGDGSEG